MGTTADVAPPGLVRPGSPDWDAARLAWNLAVDQHPEAVAVPRSAEEVAAAVAWARTEGLRLAVQSTGHGASARGGLAGSLLVNMSGMRGVTVDPALRIARAEGGAIWQDVVDVASPHGLAALHGSAHDVGVAGYTLGGGLGWLARRHGLACNAVTAVEAVLPDGTVTRAEGDDDLLWALRGGGGAFGVVTAIEFRLLPIAEVYAGWLIWPWERSGEVLSAWAEWCETVPEDITSVGRLLQLPPLPELPEPMRGAKLVVVEACCLGDREEADRILAPLRALGPVEDTFATMPAGALTRLHMDPPEPVPGIADGGLLDSLPARAVEALVESAGPGSGSPLLSVEVRHLGGALDRAGDGALAYLDGAFALFAVGLPMAPGMAEAIDAAIDRVLGAMAPFGFGRRYLNFAERPCDARAAFDGSAAARLAEVRGRVDPKEIMHPNHDPAPLA
ncbi:MAG: FAD-binding oxidoreductase [Miltoncostaeaceae bacterium]